MARLPFDTRDAQARFIDLRRDGVPVKMRHAVREIDDVMEDIVYNAVDTLQSETRANELRMFQYNMMSDREYRNRDFEDLVALIADIIDVAIQEGKYRDVRDAVIPLTEEIIRLHVAFLTFEYPDLMDFVPNGGSMARDLDRGSQMYEKYLDVADIYRRNGNTVRGRGRERDDRDDRGRDRGGRANYGSDRGGRDEYRGSGRRDRWNREGVRGGVHGSPQRSVSRENRFNNNDQTDRFNDTTGATVSNDRQGERDNRYDSSRDRNRNDRFEDAVQGTRGTERPARVQHLPGYKRQDDIADALARENAETEEGTAVERITPTQNHPSNGHAKNPILAAFENQDAWLPSVNHPHPLVFNHTQDLFYELDTVNEVVIPRVVDKDNIVNYYDHKSLAFGSAPKDFARFEDNGVTDRVNTLHTALMNPSEDFAVDGSDATITYHNKKDFTQDLNPFMSYGLKDVMLRLGFRRFGLERTQINGDKFHPVEIAIAKAFIIEPFLTTVEEKSLLEELRSISSFTKLAEKMKSLAKKLRPELHLLLDRYFTTSINRMLRQNLSIPGLRITSFTSDWLELFSHLTESYGNAYRDAISTHQENEIRMLMTCSSDADLYVLTQMPDDLGPTGLYPFVAAMPTKIIHINEVGYNLDVDMVPDVASQLLPEANPFFHDLVQELLTTDAASYGRFYIQTSDMRVIEASRSFISDTAIMVRMIR